MNKIPVISGKDLVKALKNAGYELDHQTGSHFILRHIEEPHRRLSVPNHKELAKGTLKKLLDAAGMTIEELRDLV
jgi:predicted RNA binding protein YcfA (HicA-like mRNA interferase family)